MNNLLNFRQLEEKDITDVLEIYNYHIINGLNNFEEELISYPNFKKICNKILNEKLPFIICLKNNQIIGFSYLTKFRNKSGYRFSFENSVYIHYNFMGMGIGNLLLKELIKSCSKNLNIKTIIAMISKNSIASIKIHKKNDFKIMGSLKKVGFKKNKWLDVIYMQKNLFKNEKN